MFDSLPKTWTVVHPWSDDHPDLVALQGAAHRQGLALNLLPWPVACYGSGEWYIPQEHPVMLGSARWLDHVMVIQSLYPQTGERALALQLVLRALRHGGARWIALAVPFVPYGRQDKKDIPVHGWDVMTSLLQSLPVDHMITLDPHTPQQFSSSAWPFTIQTVSHEALFAPILHTSQGHWAGFMAPDKGSLMRARPLAALGHKPWGALHKTRSWDGHVKEVQESHYGTDLSKGVNGHWCVVDDMIDSGNTLVHSIRWLYQQGAEDVSAWVSHGLFSHAHGMDALRDAGLRHMWVTTSIDPPIHRGSSSWITRQTWGNHLWDALPTTGL